MKKVAIVTLYGDFNYGNKLQNYAVYKILNKEGFSVINIKNNRHLNYNENIIKSFLKFILSKLKYYFKKRSAVGWKYYKIRKNNFKKFAEMIPTTKDYFTYKSLEKYMIYDYYVVGSDQVWNPYMALDDLSLFKGFENAKKISIAASFAVSDISDISDILKKELSKNLNDFKNISVREEAGKGICDSLLTNKESTLIVDPTMMISKEEWYKVIKKPSFDMPKNYILLAFLGEIDEKSYEIISDLSKKNNLEIINLYEKNSKWTSCGPSEFLFLEKNAKLICTDSFHSSVFGILFETPILVFGRNGTRENMNSRIETLLKKFNLENRKFDGNITNEIFECDYSKCKDVLLREQKIADDFIANAFNRGEGGQ